MSEEILTIEQQEEDRKRLNLLKVVWPAAELGGGFNKAYFSTYAQFLYTNVYHLSAAFTGVLSTVQLLLSWAGTPIIAAFIDRFSFKNAKYWPWILYSSTIVYACWILLFSLPAVGVSGENVGIVALILSLIISLTGPFSALSITAVYPQMSSDPKDRSFFSQMQKIGRDGGKTVFGMLVPLMLVWFSVNPELNPQTGAVIPTTNAYALCAIIIGVITVAFYALLAFGLKGSYVERRALARSRTATGQAKKGIPLSVMLKTVFTNRPLLCMFMFMSLHKSYYFIYISCAAYVFNYKFNNFALMATFNSIAFNLMAIIGVMLGQVWRAFFKETKRCFVACFIVHCFLLAAIAVTFKNTSSTLFLVLFGASSFFMGLLENYILPMFAAASDYGAWKAGNRLDGLTMSIYSLTITTGSLVATLVRSPILAKIGLDQIAQAGIDASELEIFPAFLSGLGQLFGWIPLGMGIAALLFLIFGFNLNDERIAIINDELKEGKTANDSSYRF